jgi:hypothetical protein
LFFRFVEVRFPIKRDQYVPLIHPPKGGGQIGGKVVMVKVMIIVVIIMREDVITGRTGRSFF